MIVLDGIYLKLRLISYKEDIIKSTQEIVRIKSVEEEAKPNMPFGEGPYKALEFAFKSMLKKWDLKLKI